ncbi:MAG: flagellar biosynthetic protein FlhB [Planctomycetota bacterium]|jgi:flagellar biosynthetic protein FlhB
MSEGQNEGQERTEEATPKRQEDSKEKGQASRSRELNTMVLLLMASSGFFMFGGLMVNNMSWLMINYFSFDREQIYDSTQLPSLFLQACFSALEAIAPLLIILFLAAFFAPMMVGGWIFSVKALSFKWEKMDPIKGMTRILGVQGLMELLKALAKFTLMGGLAILLLWARMDELLYLGLNGLGSGMSDAGNIILWSFMLLSAATMLIAGVDVPFQLWEHSKQLKMTKQEVREEQKETEGKPEVKSQIRAMQQELSNRRMLEQVPFADVVITNPTHYAVALRYDQGKMSAPRLVARGVDFMAQRIRLIADQNKVTTFTSPLLARALYFNTKLDQEIPAGLYLAVAQILAYIYQLRESRRNRDVVVPDRPTQLPIPPEFKTE